MSIPVRLTGYVVTRTDVTSPGGSKSSGDEAVNMEPQNQRSKYRTLAIIFAAIGVLFLAAALHEQSGPTNLPLDISQSAFDKNR